jgi:hypothetical protein
MGRCTASAEACARLGSLLGMGGNCATGRHRWNKTEVVFCYHDRVLFIVIVDNMHFQTLTRAKAAAVAVSRGSPYIGQARARRPSHSHVGRIS